MPHTLLGAHQLYGDLQPLDLPEPGPSLGVCVQSQGLQDLHGGQRCVHIQDLRGVERKGGDSVQAEMILGRTHSSSQRVRGIKKPCCGQQWVSASVLALPFVVSPNESEVFMTIVNQGIVLPALPPPWRGCYPGEQRALGAQCGSSWRGFANGS